MCNSANASIVDNVIEDLIAAGTSFTAWDVTREAQKRGADESHYHLKKAVHTHFFSGDFQNRGYARALVQIGSPPPFLYHPVTEDPQDYEDAILNGTGAGSPTDGVTTTATPTVDLDTVFRDPDAAGRLCIPKGFLAEIHATSGSSINVSKENGKLVVSKTDPAVIFKSYAVNGDGRVRVSKDILDQTCGSTGGQYEISLDADENKILIEVA